jgi:hypothetical protein
MIARRAALVALAVIVGDASMACRRGSSSTSTDAGAPASSTATTETATETTGPTTSLDLLEASPRCRVEHRGVLIDLGTSETAWATPGHPDAATDFPAFERDGATWGRILDRTQSFTVALDASGPALVSIRGRAKGAKKATALVDGKVVGVLALSPTEDRIATATNASLTLTPGMHVVSLKWSGAVKPEEPLAELDWIRLGVADDDPSAYAAPTRRDVIDQVAIAGAPRRAYVLRAPSVVRCVAWVPPGARLAAQIGAVGEGTGEVELRVRDKGASSPQVVQKLNAIANAWTDAGAPISTSGGVVVVEIAVTRAPKQGRVAIGEPRIVLPSSPLDASTNTGATAKRPAAPQSAVVIVLAGAMPAQLDLPSLKKIAGESVIFRGHRATSSLAAASVASLVTGLPVPVHAVEDAGARLSPRTPLVGRALAPFGVETAMFTEAPTTGPAFGFAHDWAHYAARSPLDGPPAAFDEVEKFLQGAAGKKTLIVAHARGAHPPWEVSNEALKSLPPEGYGGSVEPKHVVTLIAKARRGQFHLNEADRKRLGALQDVGLAEQDRRLDEMIAALRTSGALDKTLLVVTGDVPFVLPSATAKGDDADADASTTPLTPGGDPLAIPLVVRFPGAFGGGRVVTAITDPTDVAATVLAAFGASIGDLAGRDLVDLAVDDTRARDAARLLDDGHGYQLAWGELRLVGSWGKAPALRLGNDATDLRVDRPYEYLAAWGLAADARERWLAARAKGPGREPATIDGATASAMESWERSK